MSQRFQFNTNAASDKPKTCFICYDRDNASLDSSVTEVARRLAADLRARGVIVHGDNASIGPSAEWGDSILDIQNKRISANIELMRQSDNILLLVSNRLNTLGTNSYQAEYFAALNLQGANRLQVLPILCEGSLQQNMPPLLAGKLAIAFTDISRVQTDRSLYHGNYADLFASCILKAFNLAISAQTQPAAVLYRP